MALALAARRFPNTVLVSPCPTWAWYLETVSLVQLESFVAVAEEGNLGRAAQRLAVTQPPLTRRIRALEEDLGVVLFDRTAKGMALRPEGEALLAHARAILEHVEVARVAVRTFADPHDLHHEGFEPVCPPSVGADGDVD